MSEQSDIEKRTLTLTRTFNAPRSLVWEAWTQPENIAKWWGPNGMQTTIKKHNFQEGGEWEFAMTMPNGGEFITNGTYVKIVPPELIETNADFKPMTEGVYLIIQLEESGLTKLRLLLRWFTRPKNIANNKKKWAFTMDGVPFSITWPHTLST